MKARLFGALAVSVTATGLLAAASPATAAPAAPVLHCNTNYFCAYINTNYDGILLASNAPRGTSRVSVGGGTSSGANNTSNYWKGVNDLCCGVPDDDIFTWAPYTEVNLGRAQQDKINYFAVQ
jgi:hypothetical protein